MENEAEGRLLDELLYHLAGQSHASRPFQFHVDRDEIRPVSAKSGAHPAPDDRPPHNPGQKAPHGPEGGDNFNLPGRPPHIF
jgi:hypothetical protein